MPVEVRSTRRQALGIRWIITAARDRNEKTMTERLSAELHGMDRMGRLLFEVGAPLHEAVHEAFEALKLGVVTIPGSENVPNDTRSSAS